MIRACWVAACWLLTGCLSAAGCRLRGLDGPVPRSLVLSRQLSQQGVGAMERGNWARADELLAQAVKVFPQDAEARYRYAEVLWQRQQRAAALEQSDKALSLAPDDPKILLQAAQMRIATDHVSEASDLIDRAIGADPNNPAVWTLRGRLRHKAGQLPDALGDYHRALGFRPDDRDTLLEVAEVYRQLNRPERALATLQTLCETYPPGEERPQVLYLTGLAYSATGRYVDAIEAFSLARSRGTATPDLLYWLADAQFKAGRQNDARQTASELLALEPTHRRAVALLQRLDIAQRSVTAGYR
jgi:tetratricopeptide (TPR) repeat protein